MGWLNLRELLLALLISAVIGAVIGVIAGTIIVRWMNKREAAQLTERMEMYGISLCGDESGRADGTAGGGRVPVFEGNRTGSAGKRISDPAGRKEDRKEGGSVNAQCRL